MSNEVKFSDLSVKANNDHHAQIKSWIWETAVKYGFQDICQRIEDTCNLKDLIETFFGWGKNSELLRWIFKLREIIREIETQTSISIESLSCLQSLSLKILRDSNFHEEKEFVNSLVCLHHIASLLSFVETGQVKSGDSSYCLPTDASQWSKVKQFLGFKDDYHKPEYIRTSQVVEDCKRAILKKNLNETDLVKCQETLLFKLKSVEGEVVNRLRPPTLNHFCNSSTRKELQILNSPVHALLLKHITGDVITCQCLHSLLDELRQLSPEPSSVDTDTPNIEPAMKRKMPSRSGFQKRMTLAASAASETLKKKNTLDPVHCRNRAWHKDYDIVILKGVAWELRNVDTGDVDQGKPLVQSRGVVDIIRNCDSSQRSGMQSSDHDDDDDVYEIRLKQPSEALSNGVADPVENLSKELDSMAQLIENTKMLVAELEARYENLRVQRDDLMKFNGDGSSDETLIYDKERSTVISPIVSCLNGVENRGNGSRSRLDFPSNLDGARSKKDDHRSCEIDCGISDLEEGAAVEATVGPTINDVSMPELIPQFANVNENFPSNPSTSTMPHLTPNSNVQKRNPFVRLTPLKQAVIDKHSVGDSASLPCPLSSSESRKRTTKLKRRTRVSSSDNNTSSSCEMTKSSLSKIDLRVTELHSSSGNDVVVLESGKPSNSISAPPRKPNPSPKKTLIYSSPSSPSPEPNRKKTLIYSSASSPSPEPNRKTNHKNLKVKKSNNACRDSLSSSPTRNKRQKPKLNNNNNSTNNNSNKQHQQKVRNRKKSTRRPLIITSTLWNRRICSSSSCSDSFSSGTDEPLPFGRIGALLQSLKGSNSSHSNQGETDSNDHLPANTTSSNSHLDFFTPAQIPSSNTLSQSLIVNTSSVKVTPGNKSSSKSSETTVQNLSQESVNSKTKNCKVNLKLKKIHLGTTDVDVYS